MAPDYKFGCIHCGYTLYIGKFNEQMLSNLHNHHCQKCGAEGHMNWAAIGEGDRFEQEDTDSRSIGCCGKHEHSNEEGL